MRRLGHVDDIASAILYLVSPAGAYVTGKIIEVDGGLQSPNLEIPSPTSKEAPMPYRVVQWSTGNVGRHALAGIHAHPDLQLVGVYVSNPDKVGHDAGELAGLAGTFGVAATSDVDALLALKPDCIVHTAMADDRIFEAMPISSVSSPPASTWCPRARSCCSTPPGRPDGRAAHRRGGEAGVSIFVNGVDPGFANDALPLVLSGVSERIEEVRCSEVLNYDTYNQPMVLFGIMGFGGALDDVPLLLAPGSSPWPGAPWCARSPPVSG